jgi:hypothetical protein
MRIVNNVEAGEFRALQYLLNNNTKNLTEVQCECLLLLIETSQAYGEELIMRHVKRVSGIELEYEDNQWFCDDCGPIFDYTLSTKDGRFCYIHDGHFGNHTIMVIDKLN